MKRIHSAFLALVVSAALVVVATSWKHSVTAVHAQGGCSNATLTGNYGFIYNGSNAPGHSVTGKNTFGNAAVGVFTFDGAGNVTVSYTAVFNGHAFSTSVPDTGTYTVNSDCTAPLQMRPSTCISIWLPLVVETSSSRFKRMKGLQIHSTRKSSRTESRNRLGDNPAVSGLTAPGARLARPYHIPGPGVPSD